MVFKPQVGFKGSQGSLTGIDSLLCRKKFNFGLLHGIFGNFRAPGAPLNGDRSTSSFLWNNVIGIGTKSGGFITKI